MSIRRIALIFDSKSRPETTGVYVRRALDRLVEVEHYLPSESSRIPRAGFDLYLNIDDGLEYRLARDLRPCAWCAIDTHLNFDWCCEKAQDFDLVFAAQCDGAEQLRAHGIASATWLPLACDPDIHCKHEATPKRHDVAFVGHVFPGRRADLLELLRQRFPNTFVGQRYFDAMAETYSAARVVFNRSVRNDVNMRVFEALACGSLLVTNDLNDNGQGELFRDGVHLATYRDHEELLDKVAYYLAHDAARERIAAAGRAEVLARHTYHHRMERLLLEVEAALASRPKPGFFLKTGFLREVQNGAPLANPDPERNPQKSGVAQLCPQKPGVAEDTGFHATDLRDSSYFDHPRPEIIELIPRTARSVLDIGCGAGRLGEVLKARQPARVAGIELDSRAAHQAQERLDEVLVGDVEQIEPGFNPGSFDAVICGDILEHLREPERLLRRVRDWVAPGGRLVASVPNVRHHSVVRALLDGNWTYESAGLLDRDHLRFFTRRELEKLLWRAGFDVEDIRIIPGPGDEALLEERRPGEVKVGRIYVAGMDPAEADEFYAYQFLVTAQPAPRPDFGLTSIVIVTHNELGYTHQCVDSLRRLTDEPFELICVDTIPADCGRKLRALADREHDRAVYGYIVQVHCPGGGADEDPDADVTVVDHVKLVRNRPELRFDGRIHEQILPAIRRAGGEVAWTDLYVVHSGSDHRPEAQAKKRERDLRLLNLELKERPEHPFTLFNLGMTHANAEEFEAAAEYLARSVARSGAGESHLRKAYALLVYSLLRLRRLDEAETTCRAGLELFPLDAELRFRWGALLHEAGRNEESVQVYLDILERQEQRHFTSVDLALTGFKARQNLAVVYAALGEWANAERQWREVVRAAPRYREGWRGLGEVLLRRAKRDEAQALAEYLEAESTEGGSLRVEGLMLRGRAAAARGDLATARTALESAAVEHPDELEPMRALCQFLFEQAEPAETERALVELARRAQGDASVHHNLGLVALRRQRYDAAIAAFHRSLELRPDTPGTLLQLGYAYKCSRRTQEAFQVWKLAQRRAPDDRAATEALRTCARSGVETTELALLV